MLYDCVSKLHWSGCPETIRFSLVWFRHDLHEYQHCCTWYSQISCSQAGYCPWKDEGQLDIFLKDGVIHMYPFARNVHLGIKYVANNY